MDVAQEIQSVVAKFVGDVADLAKRAALATASSAFSSALTSVARPPARSAAPPARLTLRARPRPVPFGLAGKRSAEQIASLRDRILLAVQETPGARTEQLNEALGTQTKDLVRPIQQLLALKQLRTEGQRRGTRYFAAGRAKA